MKIQKISRQFPQTDPRRRPTIDFLEGVKGLIPLILVFPTPNFF